VVTARALVSVPLSDAIETADQRIALHCVSWKDFERFIAMRGERSVPRIAYLEGELELMSPSRIHEQIKSIIGRLVEAWAEEMELPLWPIGSWLVKQREKKSGIEPDECYVLGGRNDGEVPDLAIEVVWTSGGLDKLEIYRRLRIHEVWFWKKGAISVHLLAPRGYVQAERSALLPALDLALLAKLLEHDDLLEAKRRIRASARSSKRKRKTKTRRRAQER